MPTTTDLRPMTCTECGSDIIVIGTRTHSLLRHMINAGEVTVGEAREELRNGFLPADAAALVASWVLDRADQGDDWKAGDPETGPCGCRYGYADPEQVDPCEAHAA